MKFCHTLAFILTTMGYVLTAFSTVALAATANIYLDKQSGIAPLQVSITCTAYSTDATPLRFVIDYGDGQTETVETSQYSHIFIHTYDPGLFKPYFTAYMTAGTNKVSDPATLVVAKWKFKTGGEVDSSPAVGTDAIYIGSDDKNFYAINPETGEALWHYQTMGAISASPAIGPNGTIYIGSQDNHLYAFRPNSSLKWSLDIGDAIFSSPAIGADGTIYLGASDGNLYSITPSGAIRWSYATGGPIVSSPSIGFDGLEDIIYFGSTDKHVYAVAADNGTLKWRFKTNAAVYGSPAISADGRIYVGECETGHANEYNFKFFCLNIDGTKQWDYDTGSGVYGSPAIGPDNNVYFGTWDGTFFSLSLAGAYKWSVNTYRSFNSSPAIGDNGLVYVGCKNSTFYGLINPSEYDQFDKQGKRNAKNFNFVTGNDIGLSSPAIGSNGTLYFGSRDHYVYAINPGNLAPAESAWPMFRKNASHEGRAEGIVIPDVISSSPALNADDVEPTISKISITFSPDITEPSDIDIDSFSVKTNTGSTELVGYAVLDWDHDNLIATFFINKDTPLVYETQYRASIGYTNTEGESKTYSWTFTVIAEPEIDPNPSPSPSFCFIDTARR